MVQVDPAIIAAGVDAVSCPDLRIVRPRVEQVNRRACDLQDQRAVMVNPQAVLPARRHDSLELGGDNRFLVLIHERHYATCLNAISAVERS